MADYYSRWIRKAFGGPLWAIDTIALVLTMVGGVIVYLRPEWDATVRVVLWAVPMGALVTSVLVGLFRAPYSMHRLLEREVEQTRAELQEWEDAQPRIVFDCARESPLFKDSQPIYHVIQAWFRNVPVKPTQQSIASQVSAMVAFFDTDGTNHRFQVYGEWAIPTAPDHVGHRGVQPVIDIPPNDMRAKLNVALKYEDAPVCYGYSLETFGPYPDGRNPGLELPIGNYRVRVILRGIGVGQEHWLELVNPGPGASLVLRSAEGP